MKIDILRQTPFAIALINAMSVVNPTDFTEAFGLTTKTPDGRCSPVVSEVNVEVRVNGVLVPFVEESQLGMDAMMANLDEAIKEAAVKMLKGSKLYGLMSAIDNAEWQIKQALEEAGITDAL